MFLFLFLNGDFDTDIGRFGNGFTQGGFRTSEPWSQQSHPKNNTGKESIEDQSPGLTLYTSCPINLSFFCGGYSFSGTFLTCFADSWSDQTPLNYAWE